MAIFRLQITSLGRGAGRRATAAAAYRAGERIRDARSGDVHDFSQRKDVLHTEIMLPAQFAGASVDWARDRSTLWNAAEQAENRRTARVAREFQVMLPVELSPEKRLNLARAFSQEVADRYNIAVDLAVHEPRAGKDPRNFHAHLLGTTREVTASGLGAKAGLDMHSDERRRRGLANGSQEFTAIRERWATLTNEALREAGLEVRVDHRSLAAQGIDREPTPFIPFEAVLIEKSGRRSDVAEHLRSQYQARLQARLDRAAGRGEGAAAEAGHAASRVLPAEAGRAVSRELPAETGRAVSRVLPADSRSLEEVRRDAAEAWRRMRFGQDSPADGHPGREVASAVASDPRHDSAKGKSETRDRALDDDYSL